MSAGRGSVHSSPGGLRRPLGKCHGHSVFPWGSWDSAFYSPEIPVSADQQSLLEGAPATCSWRRGRVKKGSEAVGPQEVAEAPTGGFGEGKGPEVRTQRDRCLGSSSSSGSTQSEETPL